MIELKNISLSFEKVNLFKNFNLKIKENEKILIYGKSGIGKSTIIKLIMGFIQPDEGEVLINGKKLDKKNIWNFRKRISYVSQENDLTGGRVKSFISDVFNFKANREIEFETRKIKKFMSFFDLNPQYLNKEFQDLSGGEKQRIAIITSILLNKDIYLLDEITSSLDNKMKKKVVDFFIDDMNKTEIIISHDNHWLDKKNIRVVNLEGN